MLHLLAQAFLGLASPVSGVLLSALSGVLANGGGRVLPNQTSFALDWNVVSYQISLSHILVILIEYCWLPA